LGINLLQGYGSTEGGGISIMINRDECSRIGSAGRVSHNVEVKIVDIVTGEPLSVGQKGELCVRGPAIMTGDHANILFNAHTFPSAHCNQTVTLYRGS
jgi:long-subunit acyl-CoA synthetase (AMP-forming)